MKKIPFYLLASLLLATACSEADLDTQPEEEFEVNFTSTEDSNVLNQRVTTMNSPAMSVNQAGQVLSYNQVAEIAPNQVNGQQLSATAVAYLNNNVYVTYHIRGEAYGGEILTFDISNPSSPELLKSITDNSADFNDIMMGQHSGNIWVAGARDIYVSRYSNTNGGIATKIGLDGQKRPKNNAEWEAPLASYSGSSITRTDPPRGQSNGRIFVTSGSQGGLSVIRGNDENEIFHTRQVNEAKHFDYDGDKGVFLRGNGDGTSSIDVYELDDSFSYATYSIPFDVTYLGKNGIDVEGNVAYLAMGDDGLVKVSIEDGTVLGQYDHGGSGFTNAVKVAGDYLYIANGSDGLLLVDKDSMELVAQYDFDGSCNYVDVNGSLVFIANGDTGGLIILQEQ